MEWYAHPFCKLKPSHSLTCITSPEEEESWCHNPLKQLQLWFCGQLSLSLCQVNLGFFSSNIYHVYVTLVFISVLNFIFWHEKSFIITRESLLGPNIFCCFHSFLNKSCIKIGYCSFFLARK